MAILRKGDTLGVCVHHSAVKPAAKNLTELKLRAKQYDAHHKAKSINWNNTTNGEYGFKYLRYHYMIAYDGSLLQVQDEKYALYHAGDNFRNELSFNLHGIAVLIDGNYEEEKPNEKQMLTLVKLIRSIESRYDINARVRAHKETSKSATACAGRNIGTHDSGWLELAIINVNDKNYPPEMTNPCEKYIEEVKILKEENTALRTQLANAQDTIKEGEGQMLVLLEQLQNINAELEETQKERKEWEEKYGTLKINYNTLENDKLKIQKELDALKQGRDDWINRLADALHKLFGMNK